MAVKGRHASNDADDYDDAGGASEVAAFKKGLSSVDLQTLRGHLEGQTITRKWKRDLVEAEYARRTGDDPDAMEARPRGPRLKTKPWGRWVAAIIIAVCCVILAYTLYQLLEI